MTDTTALAVRETQELDYSAPDFVAKLARDKFTELFLPPGQWEQADILACFLACKQTGLNPACRQIWFIPRTDGFGQDKRTRLMPQTGIDGYRLIADRTGQRNGEEPPQWCGEDGVWKDIWTSKQPPVAARVRVYRKGQDHPYYGIAHYEEYCPVFKDRNSKEWITPPMWRKMPAGQLAKCAEALANRKAFPQETANVLTDTEMEQADSPPTGPDLAPINKAVDRIERAALRSEVVQGEIIPDSPPPQEPAPGGNPLETDLGKRFGQALMKAYREKADRVAWIAAECDGKTSSQLTCQDMAELLPLIEWLQAARARGLDDACRSWCERLWSWTSPRRQTHVNRIRQAIAKIEGATAEEIAELQEDHRQSLLDAKGGAQ